LTPREAPQLAESKLSTEEGKMLVQTARLAIAKYLENNQVIKAPEGTPEKLWRKSGVFVTLNTAKPAHELRGCIGFPYPEEALVNATIKAAIYAATEDPRFPPVSLDEFKDAVVVELTVLTQPQVLKTRDRKTLPDMIKVGHHGLVVEGKGTSGLLLPQVATEWNWDASEFLTNCCLKAGLPPDSWLLDGIEVKVFEGEIFEELQPAGDIRRKAIGGS
jgi:uncharacterized protein (TIGR00296 family)